MLVFSASEAIRIGSFFAEKTHIAHAVYSNAEANGFIVKPFTEPTGLELEIINP